MGDISKRLSHLSPEKLELLQRKLAVGQERSGAFIGNRKDVSEYPMSAAQEQLWFLDQMAPGNPFYNIAAGLRIEGKVDVDKLRRAIDSIVQRHEVLRSRYVAGEKGPKQIVEKKFPELTKIVELAAGDADVQARIAGMARADASTPFDLTRGPLLRTTIVKIAPNDIVLLIVFHHIVADGWSMPIFIRDVAAIYQSGETALSPLKIQYSDFAAWQGRQLNEHAWDDQLEYWKTTLAGMPHVLDFPVDKTRPPVSSFKGDLLHFELPGELAGSMRAICRDEGVTPFAFLLASFQALIYRYSHQQDFGIGIPAANRRRPEVQPLIGFFVNSLVIRCNEWEHVSFRRLLRNTSQAVLSAFENQELPFEKLVEELGLHRDMARMPLFQIMFAMQSNPVANLEFDARMTLFNVQNESAKFDLLLMINEDNDNYDGYFEYSSDLFLPETVQRLADHLRNLIARVVEDLDVDVTRVDFLNPGERQKVLVDWASSGAVYPVTETIHSRIEQRVKQYASNIAVLFGNEKLTYGDLNQRANRLAHQLLKLGVTPEAPVALYLERGLDIPIAALAVLKSGAAYLPIDPVYPAERVAFMLKDSGASIVLAHSSLADNLPRDIEHLLLLDQPQAEQDFPDTNPGVPVPPSQLAYIIYTSGSSGRPKGALIAHKNVLRLFESTNDYFHFSPKDVWTLFHSYAFDFSVWEMFGALLYGGRLVIVSYIDSRSPERFTELVAREGVTVLNQTPTAFQQFMQAENKITLADMAALRLVIFGGEELKFNSLKSWFERHGDVRPQLVNMYGITETTVHVTYRPILSPDAGSESFSDIGRPLPDLKVYLLDENLMPVPIGAPGELFVGGAGLMRGYLHRPQLTAEKLIPDPYSDDSDDCLYRSGDLAKYTADGRLLYLGRIDNQVQMHGFRIELGEIEAVLNSHPKVRQSVVILRQDEPGEQKLVAYIVADAAEAATTNDFRDAVRKSLPEYMMPAAFVKLNEMPMTSNGKIDKRALPPPNDDRPELRNAFRAPSNSVEQLLVDIWQDVLGLKKIGVNDNYFELGGNSIKAAIIANRLQEKLQESFHVGALFFAPTVAELAVHLAEYFPVALKRVCNERDVESLSKTDIVDDLAGDRVTAFMLDAFRRHIPAISKQKNTTAKNKQMIFVLSPPRSGSTLLRVMLAGNPALFSPPELELMAYATLRERRRAFQGDEVLLEGALSALMHINECDAEQAAVLMQKYEADDLSVKEFYALLQEWLGDKLLVDKTPVYSLQQQILERMEENFADALYIHLVRHPYATIYSFIEAKQDRFVFRKKLPFTTRQLAELVWHVCHANILAFLANVPKERQFFLRFEELVSAPDKIMSDLCRFVGVDYNPEMLAPYSGHKMTQGVSANTPMVGDVKFYLHKKIDADVATRWRKHHRNNFLSEPSWQLAERLGYSRSSGTVVDASMLEIARTPRDGDLPLSFAQQRLWFLDQMEPNNPFYNIPAAIKINGPLNVDILEKSLNSVIVRHEVLRTGFKTVDGKATQIIHEKASLSIDRLVIKDKSTDVDLFVQDTARKMLGIPFDLSKAPLMRAGIVQNGDASFALIIVMHHIISDGWSMNILIREVVAFYQAFASGKSAELPTLPIQYVDFAAWQREFFKAQFWREHLDYWQQKLADAPVMLDLPLDHSRPPIERFRGSRILFEIPGVITEALDVIGKNSGATLFSVLLAAFYTLLFKLSRQRDILIGTPTANRTRSELEPLIGFFINTLVLRANIDDRLGFDDFLRQVQNTVSEAFKHQDVQFEQLLNALDIKRSLSHAPLFQVMFAYQESSANELSVSDLQFSPFGVNGESAKFDMTVSLVNEAGLLRGIWEYSSDIFDRNTISRFVQYFSELLKNISGNHQAPLASLALIDEHVIEKLLTSYSSTEKRTFDGSLTVTRLFEEQVARTPGLPALVFRGQEMTYAELNRRANQLAHYLIDKRIGPEHIVGISLDRSLEMIVAIIAVLKAGAAYVPLDPFYPVERLRFMIKDSGLNLILSNSRLIDSLSAFKESLIALDSISSEIDTRPDTNPLTRSRNQNLCYVIYTSGSTGTPKGVLVQHNSIVNFIASYCEAFNVQTGKKIVQYFSFNFDGSISDFFPALTSGATLYLAASDELLPDSGLIQLIRDNHITNAIMPPSILSVLTPEELPDLSILISGGDVCTPDLVKKWSKGRSYYNAYGPTETTIGAAWYCTNDLPTGAASVPIGKPILNIRIYILDNHLNLCPVGVPGEMFIGGAGVSRGYLNRPDLTAERFIPDPFCETPGARMYASGDLGRFMEDGNIEFMGRVDKQVKIRGFRIEAGEIESRLREHDQIVQVAVTTIGDPGKKQLVAYVVTRDEKTTTSELREFLKGKLPQYMVPSFIVTLDAMPFTSSGKIDYKRLPKPDLDREHFDTEYVDAETDAEKKLQSIWQELLGVEQVGVHDNFFELGGDSILSIQLVARARSAGLGLTPKQIFESPTIAGLAAGAQQAAAMTAEQGILVGETPLTPIQLFFFNMELQNRNHWNQALMLETDLDISEEHLNATIQKLMEHHDALRMRFWVQDGEWHARYAPMPDTPPLQVVDLSQLPDVEQSKAIAGHAREMQSSLDLTEGPLFRVALYKCGAANRHKLFFVVHHIIIDGVSWRILMEDIQTAFMQINRNQAVLLPPKTTSFRTWAQKQVDYVAAGAVDADFDYWRTISQIEAPSIPTDFIKGANLENSTAHQQVEFDRETAAIITHRLPKIFHAAVEELLMTLLAGAFARWSTSERFYVHVEGHGRESMIEGVDVSRTVGWFTVAYPVLIDLAGAEAMEQKIAKVKASMRKAPHNGVSYGQLRYLSKVDDIRRVLSKTAQPQISFNYLGQFNAKNDKAGLFSVSPAPMGMERDPLSLRQHILDFSAGIRDGLLTVTCLYSENLHSKAHIEQLMNAFKSDMEEMIAGTHDKFATDLTPEGISTDLTQDDLDNILKEIDDDLELE